MTIKVEYIPKKDAVIVKRNRECRDWESMESCDALNCNWFKHSQVHMTGGDYPLNYKDNWMNREEI